MAWRQQGSTGSNNIPLGNRRRFGGDSASPRDEGGYNQSEAPDRSFKRGRSPTRGEYPYFPSANPINLTELFAAKEEPSDDGSRRRKKRNRWGDATENKAAGLMGLPTAIMANMTSEQLEAYTLHLRIEEISQKLRIDDVVPADGDRYVDPPPKAEAKANDFQISIPTPSVRQLRSPCKHSRIPLPQASRRRATQAN